MKEELFKSGWYWIWDNECQTYIIDFLDENSPILKDDSYKIECFIGNSYEDFKLTFGKAR